MNRIANEPRRDLGRRLRIEGRCIAVAAALGLASAAHGQCNYEVSAIISPNDEQACAPLPPSNTFARGMNSQGEVVGYYVPCAIGNERAFFWSKDTGFVTLPKPPDVVQAFAEDINDHGLIIGRHVFSGVGGKGFVYDLKTQVFTYLEPLHPGAVATNLTTVASINNQNIVAGSRVISEPGVSPSISNAVLWLPFGDDGNGVIIDLGIGDGPRSAAEDGNDGADAAGWSGNAPHSLNARAILWTEGDAVDLGVLPGAVQSSGRGLNKFLDVVGTSRIPGPSGSPAHGFLWSKGKMLHLLPDAPYERFSPNVVTDGTQVGGALVTPAVTIHAGLFQRGHFYEVDSLVADLLPQMSLLEVGTIHRYGELLVHSNLQGRIVGALLMPLDVPTGDLDFDCTVDIHDLLYLLNEWGKPNSNADLNGNGTVGVADLLILLANWGS